MVSFIIPTLNAEATLGKLLVSLKAQTVSAEIIVVDSASSDRTVSIAQSYGARIIRVTQADFDHGGTRTEAGMSAGGDIIVYLTQDVMLTNPTAIEELIQPFSDSSVGASYGRQIPQITASFFAAHLRQFNYPEESCIRSFADKQRYGIRTPFISNSFAAYRKKALEEIGWFKHNLILSEDTYAGAKLLLANYRIAYVSKASVVHSHDYSIPEEFQRYFDIGVFHKTETWIIKEFSSTKGEGVRYLKDGFWELLRQGRNLLIFEFLIRVTAKYIGYKLGQHYNLLPSMVIRKFSMHKNWWNKQETCKHD